MKCIKDSQERFGVMSYQTRMTEEFSLVVDQAVELLEPVVRDIGVPVEVTTFLVNGEDSDEMCCEKEECISVVRSKLVSKYGEDAIEDYRYSNDGDLDVVEGCSQCGSPLNSHLTWCESELVYVEGLYDERFRKEGFVLYAILNSMPTFDREIKPWTLQKGGKILASAIEDREAFFQRVLVVAQRVKKVFGR